MKRLALLLPLLCACAPQEGASSGSAALRFDMGLPDSPLAPGFVRVLASDRYDPAHGWGFLEGGHEGFSRETAEERAHGLPYADFLKAHATPLNVDGVRDAREIRFRVDLPPGRYRVAVTAGDLAVPCGSVALLANGAEVRPEMHFHHGVNRSVAWGRPEPQSADKLQCYGFYDRVRFDADCPDGSLVVTLRRNDAPYLRRLEEERAKPAPLTWKGTGGERSGKGAEPPYDDIGEAFVANALLGIEVAPARTPPVRMTAHGVLETDSGDPDTAEAVAAFNRGDWKAAEAAADRARNPHARALAYLWLAGWPPVEGEDRLTAKALPLLEGLPGAEEDLECARTFRGALDLVLRRAEPGKSHFQEIMKALNRFLLSQPGDPLYWTAQVRAARCGYMLDPNRWIDSSLAARRRLQEVRRVFPADRYARYFLDDAFEPAGDWAMKAYDGAGAPEWAANLREAYNRFLDLSEWWALNKQKPDGSIGGGWGDDVELVGLFGYYGFVCPDASPLALDCARRLVDGMFRHSGDVDPETGFLWQVADAEHSAEWTGDTLPMMLLIDYGNPLWIERAQLTGKLMRDLWTWRNPKGHRHFRSNFLGGMNVGGAATANDSSINLRAIKPLERLLWYNAHPEGARLLCELADAWREDALSTDKGKPEGVIPTQVASATCELGGAGAPSWHESLHPPKTVNYDFGPYHEYQLELLRTAYELTGDAKYLEPSRLEAALHAKLKDAPLPEGAPRNLLQTLAGSAAREQDREGSRGRRLEISRSAGNALKLIRMRWPVMTTEASATDRVAFAGCVAPYLAMTGGDVGKGVSSLSAEATYSGTGRDFAAFVDTSSPAGLRVVMYSFDAKPRTVGIHAWALEIGGTYRVTVAPDADDDDVPDGPGTSREFVLGQRGQPFRFELPPRVPCLIRFEQTAPGRPAEPLPDLSLSSVDLEYHADRRQISVRVHNTGTKAADRIEVALYRGSPEDGELVGKGEISHLAWPHDFLPQTLKIGWPYVPKSAKETFTAVVDAPDRIPEITDLNNRATATLAFAKAPASAPPPKGIGKGRGGR